MLENKNMRCRSCRFWWPTAEGGDHEPQRERAILRQCRRHAPPVMVVDLRDHGHRYPAWSTTKRDDWCGEHQHIQQ